MFSDRTLALLVPFLVATSQATVVSPRSVFVPSPPFRFPVLHPDPSSFHQIDVPGDGAVDTQSSAQSPIQILTGGYDCQPNNDWDCYKRYYQEYNYCHPQDVWCYKDCRDWDQYKDHCYHKDFDFKCYDKCHYDHDGCGKWNECRENDYDCYKRKHEDHFPRGKDPYYKQPDGGNYCKPWDWNCHKREHHDHGDYVCNPWKDKHCYPYYYPEPHVPEKIPPRQPNNDVWVYFYSPCEGPCHEHGYTRKIWPDGDEVFTGKSSTDFVLV